MVVGVITILTIMLKFGLSGFVGKLVNEEKGRDLMIAGAILSMGWFPWFFMPPQFAIIFTMVAWATGNHFRQVGLTAQWYDAQSIACLSAQEILLGVGRIVGFIIFIPFLFAVSTYFLILGLMATISFCCINISLRNREYIAVNELK
jgi:hypothetical protein